MSDHWDDLDRNSIRAAEAKFGVRHPRHEDESATSDQCPVFTFGFRCLRDAGHSGEHGVNPEPSPERAILTDLIKELRHRHTPYRVCMECDDWYAGCEDPEHITVCLWCCTSHGYHSMDCVSRTTGRTRHLFMWS